MPAASWGSAPRCAGSHWVGVWGASPSDADPSTSRSLAGATVRTVVTPLGSGGRVRVRLSNVLSSEPLALDAVTVARSAGGGAVAEASIRRLRFGGSKAVTIAPGGQAVSDPATLRVRAFERLAISTRVDPASDGLVTQHYLGRQTSFIKAPGEPGGAGQPSGEGFSETTTARLLVAGVDVRAPRRVGAVVAFGDSITDGNQFIPPDTPPRSDGIDEDVRYPDFLARRLIRLEGPQSLTVLNAGIAGNRILRNGLIPRMGPSGRSRLRRDVVLQPGARTAIVLEGINDIAQSAATAREVIGGLREIAERLKRARMRVVLGTLTPAGGSVFEEYGGAEANATRNAVNAWIRSQRVSDGFIDFDRRLRDPSDPGRLRRAFDSGDHLHPNAAGYRAMANAVPLRSLGLEACGRDRVSPAGA